MHAVHSIIHSKREARTCILHQTYLCGSGTLHLYSGDLLYEIQCPPVDLADWEFSWFRFQTVAGVVPWLGHDRFVPNSFQFVTHPANCRHTMWVTANAMTKPKGCKLHAERNAATSNVKLAYLSHHTYRRSKQNTVSAFVFFSDIVCAVICIITWIIFEQCFHFTNRIFGPWR